MATRVVTNWDGVEEVLTSSGTKRLVAGMAEDVLDAAYALAPVDTGAYRESLEVVTDITSGSRARFHRRRARSRVYATVDYALVVEADTGTLKRALDGA